MTVHYVTPEGGMTHAIHNLSNPPKGHTDWDKVTCDICLAQRPPVDRITEVSATVDAGLSQADLDGMNEAERLALIVGSAYGAALADRDLARTEAADLRHRLGVLLARADNVLALDVLKDLTWAGDERAVTRLRECVQENMALPAVDSDETPTQED